MGRDSSRVGVEITHSQADSDNGPSERERDKRLKRGFRLFSCPRCHPQRRRRTEQTTASRKQSKRSERWYEMVEQQLGETEEATENNSQTLSVMNEKTEWMARLVVGILVSVMAGFILHIAV